MLDSILRKLSAPVFFLLAMPTFLLLDLGLCASARSYGVGFIGQMVMVLVFNVMLYVPIRWRHMELTEGPE